MSAQRKGKREFTQIVSSIFKLVGTLAGTTVGIGKKVLGIKSSVKVKVQVASLGFELAKLESELAETQKNGKKMQSQISSQIEALQAEIESLNSMLKDVRNEGRGIKTKVTKTSGRVDILETVLATANSKLAEVQKKVEKKQSQLSAQIEILQEKNESDVVAKKIDAVKIEVDQLNQQICDSSSQTQPDTNDLTEKMDDIKKEAVSLDINGDEMKKIELIHTIQKAEGNTPCFGKSNGQCSNTNCCFMNDCITVKC